MKAFMFTGQGAQYSGMGKELYDTFSVVKETYDEADQTLGFKISDISFNGGDDLDKTQYTQPAMFTASYGFWRILKEKGINPHYFLGLSLGEYTALTAAEAMEFKEAVSLVRKRGKYMTEACPKGVGAMTAVMNLSRELVSEACNEASSFGIVSPANFNMPGQIVIAGEKFAVEKAEEIAIKKGAKRCIKLNVSGAFHTKLMESAAIKLAKDLDVANITDMNTPVVTNLTGKLISDKNFIVPTLVKQMMSPVMWEDSIKFLIDEGVRTFVEIGPGKTLSMFVKKIANSLSAEVEILNIEDVNSCENVLRKLSL